MARCESGGCISMWVGCPALLCSVVCYFGQLFHAGQQQDTFLYGIFYRAFLTTLAFLECPPTLLEGRLHAPRHLGTRDRYTQNLLLRQNPGKSDSLHRTRNCPGKVSSI